MDNWWLNVYRITLQFLHLLVFEVIMTSWLKNIPLERGCHHHHHLPPWIRSFDLFRHRRIAIVSWGVHDLFFLEVCS